MKKISFKKVMASVAALSVVSCMAAIPTAAAGEVSAKIDQVTVKLNADKTVASATTADGTDVTAYVKKSADGYQVPLYVSLVDNPGLSAVEYGIKVDDRISKWEVVTGPADAMDVGGKVLRWKGGIAAEIDGQRSWPAYDASVSNEGAMDILCVYVTIPEAQATPGSKFDVKHGDSTTGTDFAKESVWKLVVNANNEYTASWTDGWVAFEGETTTSSETTTSTTTTTTTTSTTEEPTTSSETSTSAVATTSSTAASTTSTAAATTATTAKTTAAGGTTTAAPASSPKTGSTDVLPIAGAAAAVAVLGGVALVAKKKND